MGQIHMGRANPFRALVAGLTADEFLLLREAVDERRCREEVGEGTLTEAAEAYRPDPGCPGRGCKALADELAGYVWDERSEVDRPVKVANHACDALRYGVETLRMYNRERPYRSLVLAQCRSDW